MTVVGGVNTVNLVSKIKGAEQALSLVSTGCGAEMQLLEGNALPGITCLTDLKDLIKKK